MATFKTKFSGKEYAQAASVLERLIGFIPKTEQYCRLRMDGKAPGGGSVVIKLYTNGTFMVQAASDTGLEWALSQLPGHLSSAVTEPKAASSTKGNLAKTLAYPHIGTDESGKGDYFGPLVVAGVLIQDAEIEAQLKKMGIRDGKTVTDAQIATLADGIRALLPATAIALWVRDPVAYNAAIDKAKAHGQTLNHVLACGHGTVITELVTHTPEAALAIVDQFAQNTGLVERAARHAGTPETVNIHQETKAESHVAVAAASIIARDVFLTRLQALGDEVGTLLPKGAGTPVTTAAKRLVHEQGADVLKTVAKWHFKTTQAVI